MKRVLVSKDFVIDAVTKAVDDAQKKCVVGCIDDNYIRHFSFGMVRMFNHRNRPADVKMVGTLWGKHDGKADTTLVKCVIGIDGSIDVTCERKTIKKRGNGGSDWHIGGQK